MIFEVVIASLSGVILGSLVFADRVLTRLRTPVADDDRMMRRRVAMLKKKREGLIEKLVDSRNPYGREKTRLQLQEIERLLTQGEKELERDTVNINSV